MAKKKKHRSDTVTLKLKRVQVTDVGLRVGSFYYWHPRLTPYLTRMGYDAGLYVPVVQGRRATVNVFTNSLDFLCSAKLVDNCSDAELQALLEHVRPIAGRTLRLMRSIVATDHPNHVRLDIDAMFGRLTDDKEVN